jgi:hypothetical protein
MADFRTSRPTGTSGNDFGDRLFAAANNNHFALLDLVEKTGKVCFGLMNGYSHRNE